MKSPELFVWYARTLDGDDGIPLVHLPPELRPAALPRPVPALFSTREIAAHPFIVQQLEIQASRDNVQMRLYRFSGGKPLVRLDPVSG